MPQKKTRIAVLGGGCGSMAAVWGLLESDHADEYEITVYQLGWRLGGKGASGRNQKVADRIEEHGLHVWSGCYENSFRIMQEVYGRLGRPKGTPLSVWFDPKRPEDSAFLPHNFMSLARYDVARSAWTHWNIEMPANDELPGEGGELPSVAGYFEGLVEVLIELLLGSAALTAIQRHLGYDTFARVVDRVSPLGKLLGRLAGQGIESVARAGQAQAFTQATGPFERTLAAVRALPTDPGKLTAGVVATVLTPIAELREILHAVAGSSIAGQPTLRNAYMVVDFALGIVRGALADGVFARGFDAVDDRAFSDWLVESGGCSRMTANGFLVTGWHHLFFAYAGGDTQRPSLSAGSALRTIFRFVFTYKGAFFWKMQAGMGDAVFAPLYLALRQRGVKFEFFHRIEEIGIDDGGGRLGDRVTRIALARQVDLKDPARGYDPLYEVKGVASWPSLPLYDQIVQAEELEDRDIDLESHWTPWKPVGRRELLVDRDFDLVVLGISVGALAAITPQLCEKSPRWRAMVGGLATSQTLAMQLWLKPTQPEMGRRGPSTVGTGKASPLSTWANMDQLLVRERWSDTPPPEPKSLVYCCGTLTDAPVIPGPEDHGFARAERARVEGQCAAWLGGNAADVWPRAVLPEQSSLDYGHLKIHLPDGDLVGEQRFSAQYTSVNINPSDRYVLAQPGAARHRIRSDQSGFDNLYCAGDWLATGMNAGCVEGAVMGALQASKAISGFPERIIGDEDGAPGFFTGVREVGR